MNRGRAAKCSGGGKGLLAILAAPAMAHQAKMVVYDFGAFAAWDDCGELCGIVDTGSTGGLAGS